MKKFQAIIDSFVKNRYKSFLFALADVSLVVIAVWLTLSLRFDTEIPARYVAVCKANMPVYCGIALISNMAIGLYRDVWRHAGFNEIVRVSTSCAIAALAIYVYNSFLYLLLPRSFYPIFFIILFLTLSAVRISTTYVFKAFDKLRNKNKARSRVLIVGASHEGSQIAKLFMDNAGIRKLPVGFIDDDPSKYRKRINSVPVLGDVSDMAGIIAKRDIDEVILAVPSAPRSLIRNVVEICSSLNCKIRIMPAYDSLLGARTSDIKLRDVQIEDLLGRDEININPSDIGAYVSGKKVLVTGGGGSIGSELCRQLMKFNPRQLIIVDIYENNAHDIQQELLRTNKGISDDTLKIIITSICDLHQMEKIFDEYRPDIVFHAAAHKHVPLMEFAPLEAVKNNIFGTKTVADLSGKFGVTKFILISSDKAVNPTGIMGATKRVSEIIIQSPDNACNTEFAAVRFGNVLGSDGSVIPLFTNQIKLGGPVTVTHPDVTRYFMTIPEAVSLLLQAGSMAKGGEIFVFDMGDPVKIDDLAKNLIRLSGYEPGVDIDIEYVGLRAGEKLYEELLLSEENPGRTSHDMIYVAQPLSIDRPTLDRCLLRLESAETRDEIDINLKILIPAYKPMSRK